MVYAENYFCKPPLPQMLERLLNTSAIIVNTFQNRLKLLIYLNVFLNNKLPSFPLHLITLLKLIFEGISRVFLESLFDTKCLSKTKENLWKTTFKIFEKIWCVKTFTLQIN